MANVLNDLAPDIFKAMQNVARERTGALTSVVLNTNAEELAALNQSVKSFNTREATLNTSLTPSMTIPEGDDQTVDTDTMVLDQIADVKIPWTGEDIKYVDAGHGFTTIYGKQIEQAIRKINNQMEAYLCGVLYKGASRSVGTAGTNPFASNFDILADAYKVFDDNGVPEDGMWTNIVNSTAAASLRKQAQLQKANEAGGDDLLRQGVLLDLQGFALKTSRGIQTHTKGTGASYQLNGALAIGDTTIEVDTGSGTIVAGDVVTIGNHNYVAKTAISGGSFTIANPGIQEVVADNTAITVANNRTANIFLHRDAAEFAVRPLAKPYGGDAAVDSMNVTDPQTGITYQISVYKGFYKAMFHIVVLYGGKVWNSHLIGDMAG